MLLKLISKKLKPNFSFCTKLSPKTQQNQTEISVLDSNEPAYDPDQFPTSSAPRILTSVPENELIDDYTNNPTTIKFNDKISQTGLKVNQNVEFLLKDNPLALQILNERYIDLKDERIMPKGLDLLEQQILNVDGIKKIDLGKISVIPENSILLEDVDVYNVPLDKDIILEKPQKQMVAIGRIMAPSTTSSTSENSALNVNSNMFIEDSFQDLRDKYLLKFEHDLVTLNFQQIIKEWIKYLPLWIVIFFFMETAMELYACQLDCFLMEEQEMQVYSSVRQKYANHNILNNKIFDLRNYQ